MEECVSHISFNPFRRTDGMNSTEEEKEKPSHFSSSLYTYFNVIDITGVCCCTEKKREKNKIKKMYNMLAGGIILWYCDSTTHSVCVYV